MLTSDGTLTYTAAVDGNGTATVTVVLMDDGGTANGGVDTSAPQSFDVVVGHRGQRRTELLFDGQPHVGSGLGGAERPGLRVRRPFRTGR